MPTYTFPFACIWLEKWGGSGNVSRPFVEALAYSFFSVIASNAVRLLPLICQRMPFVVPLEEITGE